MRARRIPGAALLGASALAALAVPSVAPAVGLAELYRRALGADATIAAARDELDAAAFGLPVARSALLPQLGASANVAWTRLDSELGEESFREDQWQLQLSQSVFNRTNAALAAQADAAVRQAEAEFASALEELQLRIATAWLDALRAEAGLEFARAELGAIRRQREQAERRFDTGLARITDVRTAQAQFDLADAQEIAAANALENAREALRTLTGGPVDALASLAPDLPLAAPEPADVAAWVELAVEQNTDLVVARLAAERADAQVDVERGARWPNVDLVASGGAGNTDRSLREGEARSASVGVQASLPLYGGGRIGARVAQARASLDAAADRRLGAERLAAQRARDGYRGVVAAIARVRALRRALVSTRLSADSVEAGFRAGTRDSVDVLRALRDVFRARSDFANARYDYVASSLQLQAAAGTLDARDLEAIDRFLVPAE